MKKKHIIIATVSVMLTTVYAIAMFSTLLFAPKGYDLAASDSVTIVAHRGGAGMAPENSLLCIGKGVETGAGYIEIDIRLTKDDVIVVCHDSDVKRTTDGKGKIEKMTFEQVRSFRILGPDGTPTEERIPTLDEVFALVDARSRLLIEVKPCDRYERIAQLLMESIEKHNAASWVTVQSFSDNVLFAVHALNPSFPIEKLVTCKLPLLPLIIDNGISRFNPERYHFIESFNFYHGMLRQSLIDKIHAQGKKVKIWTLDSPEETPALKVDGIITDRPDLWKKE